MLEISSSQVSFGKYLKARPSDIWRLLTDTSMWPVWGPTVMKVESADRFIRFGSKGRVKTVAGIWLPFEITAYKQCSNWSWKVASIKATAHRVTDVSESGCTLWFDTPILAAPYSLACQWALVRIEKLLPAG